MVLETLLQAFDEADEIKGPQGAQVKRFIQQAVSTLDTQQGLTLRGRIVAGTRDVGVSGAVVVTEGESRGRFNTTPPPQPVFVDPNLKAASRVQPAAITNVAGGEGDENGVKAIYAKILKQSPNQVVAVYGEGGIEGMIKTLGGNPEHAKKPNQKAAYLKQLISNKYGDLPVEETPNEEPDADATE